MNTFAWVLILAALVLGRAVYKGRVMNIGEDLSDTFLALVTNDTGKLKEVMDREGDSRTASAADLSIFQRSLDIVGGPAGSVAKGVGGMIDELERKGNSSLTLAAVILGSRAKGYRWGAAGPTYYDCSGLIWAAMKLAKIYTGSRFTTSSFASKTKGTYTQVSSPQEDDVCVWDVKVPYVTGHMGVVTGPNKFYSARSVKSGIGESSISGFRNYQPKYYRRSGFKHPDMP